MAPEKNIILSSDLATRRQNRCQDESSYAYLLENFAPRLRKPGATDATLHLVENPKRLLTGAVG